MTVPAAMRITSLSRTAPQALGRRQTTPAVLVGGSGVDAGRFQASVAEEVGDDRVEIATDDEAIHTRHDRASPHAKRFPHLGGYAARIERDRDLSG